MSISQKWKDINIRPLLSYLIPILLFWVVLVLRIPYSLTYPFAAYSFGLFVVALLLYFFSFRLPGNLGILTALGLTLFLFALTLS